MTRRKRSIRASGLRTVLLGGAAFALAACEEERVDLTYFDSLEQCARDASEARGFSTADCEEAFAAARAEHVLAAPRYESRALCEEQHGDGACGPEQAVMAEALEGEVALPAETTDALAVGPAEESDVREAGGSIFMPLMLGYMMGNMMRGSGYLGRPLYSSGSGAGLHTASGRPVGALQPGATVRGAPALLRPVQTSRPPQPLTRATIASRGGFGAARTYSGLRTFGG
jgi:uncharacterized protein YgiB involved in biofilm formation